MPSPPCRFRLRRWVLAVGVAALCPRVTRAAADERPNVLLISIDTLRADHLGCYGYGRATSPTIDRVAREGTLFANAQSASSWTTPSHMTMLTGLRPSVHGVDRPGRRLAPDRITLAQRLRDAGYDTAAFVGGPTLSRAFGFDRGFARYENLMGLPDAAKQRPGGPALPADVLQRAHAAEPAAAVGAAAARWLAAEAHAPFLLFVHLWDPHYDYRPPAPYDRFDPGYDGDFDFTNVERNPSIGPTMPERDKQHLVALYDGEIAETDAVVAGLLRTLAAQGILDRTLVVITSDHGEEFFEHGGKGHLATLFEEVVHVPLVFRLPGRIPAGRRVDDVFGPVHLMPTILGLVGVAPPPNLPGRDLSALVEGRDTPQSLWAFSEVSHARAEPLYLVRIGDLTMVGGRAPQAPLDAYDLRPDPGQHHPHPASAQKRRIFDHYVDSAIGAGSPATDAPMDAATVAELRALGYLAE